MSYNLLFACDWKWGIPWFTPNGKLKKHWFTMGGILFSETPKSPLFVEFPSSKPTVSYGKWPIFSWFTDLPIENDVFSVRYVSLPDRISPIFQCRWPFIGDFPLPRLSTRGYPKKNTSRQRQVGPCWCGADLARGSGSSCDKLGPQYIMFTHYPLVNFYSEFSH